ncbi:MAG TPA: ABC transporter substrate-binding protein [Gaiellaceae bacterium]|jgi:peptide/nickel transport system substrate-binding protein|nr:ABC transporter substrate-binding protein [Gaiellaceae bacterium]
MKRAAMLALVVALVGLTAAACGSSKKSSSSGGSTSVTISNEQGTTWTCGFNPFNASVSFLSFGTEYEELTYVDGLKSGKTTPWLAKSYAWSNGNKTLTFTIRDGVKWSDGKPFSAADVVYTFNLLKKNPALDLNANWSVLKSVTQNGNKVVFNFKTAAVPYFYYIADQTPIVAQHIWTTIKNPTTYKDTKPVGTGPFTMSSCSPQVIKYKKNPSYWQSGKPTIDTVYYPAFTSNDPANQQLASGKAQWGSQFIPNINAYYLKKSPDNHYWFPPVVNVAVYINQTDPILKNLPVRQAMAYAIDRNKVSEIGEYGYEPPSNQTGIVTPTFSDWLDQGLAKKVDYNPTKAEQILQQAGYKKVGGVYQTPDGKPLSFTMINIGGYSDWVASAQLVQEQLKAVGIKVVPQNLSSQTYDNDVYTGHYQLAYDGNQTAGPTPYYELRSLLYSKGSAPIGKTAGSDWERYSNPQVDQLIEQYAATSDSATQHKIVKQLEAAMVNDIPVIPVTEGVDWYQYNTKDIAGWVTKGDPFARPAAYVNPDWGVMLLHLKAKQG